MIVSKRHLIFTLLIGFAACLLWQLFSGFNIDNIENGYDSYRFVSHALGNCSGSLAVACGDKHVVILSKLGNSIYFFSVSFFLLSFGLFFLSIKRQILLFLLPGTPLILYYLGQPGKDFFTLLGTIAFFSLLCSDPALKIFTKKGFRLYSFAKYLSLCMILGLSIFLRPQLVFWYLVFLALFAFDTSNKSSIAWLLTKPRLAVIVLACAFAIMNILSSTTDFEAVKYFDSDFASYESLSFLVGFSPLAFFARVIFQPLYLFSYPFSILVKDFQGYQLFFAACLAVQSFVILSIFSKSRASTRPFVINLLILSLLISSYPIPNIRYYAVFIPSLLALHSLLDFKIKNHSCKSPPVTVMIAS
jgi:predicted outer membrane lipoprotein